jgi:hypothetical protein
LAIARLPVLWLAISRLTDAWLALTRFRGRSTDVVSTAYTSVDAACSVTSSWSPIDPTTPNVPPTRYVYGAIGAAGARAFLGSNRSRQFQLWHFSPWGICHSPRRPT